MAFPSKRICVQAARNVSRYTVNNSYHSSGPIAHHTRHETPLLPSVCRLAAPRSVQKRDYSRTWRRLAVDSARARAGTPLELQPHDEADEEAAVEYLINESEISSLGHSELAQHREMREMVRIAAWEMPLLSELAKPFEPPDKTAQPLRWRYTTYMGESHPAGRKVVVEFHVDDLVALNDRQRLKLKKLVGARLNPDTNVVRMSCESFETQAQNKRYLGDTIQKLLVEAKDLETDSFEDIPLDTRHHKPKKTLEFPEEWKMTKERRALLEAKRQASLLEEERRAEQQLIASGTAAIADARQTQQTEQAIAIGVKPGQSKSGSGGSGTRR